MKVVFESERIKYVPVQLDLINDYLLMVNDIKNVGRFVGREEIISKDKEIEWINKKLDEKKPVFSMLDKSNNKFIGNIELMDANTIDAELGIAITKTMQDKGYGSEAIKRIIEYGFYDMGLKRIFLKAISSNSRAIHVYAKCGFKECGKTEKHVFMEIY